jgi:hypothetical protein
MNTKKGKLSRRDKIDGSNDLKLCLAALFRMSKKAGAGDTRANAEVFRVAEMSTWMIEGLADAQPEIVRQIANRAGQFPALHTSDKQREAVRVARIAALQLDQGGPFKPNARQQDEQYRMIRYAYYPAVEALSSAGQIRKLPALCQRTAKQWARAMADYAVGSVDPHGPISDHLLTLANPGRERRRRQRRAFARLNEKIPGDLSGEFDEISATKLELRTKKISAMKFTRSDFKIGFASSVAQRLRSMLRK